MGVIVEFSDDLGTATQHSTEAMRLMAQHRIPATPQNFAVWYTYVSDREPDLKRTLDVLVSNGQEFTEAQNAEIYEKFFGQLKVDIAVHETGDQMSRLMTNLASMVERAAGDAQEFGATLEDSAGSLTNDSDISVVRQVVEALATETRKMASQNRQLQHKLEDSSAEIASLKKNLQNIQKEALTDGLTEIANRKSFDVALRAAAIAAMENGDPLCLVMTDIDHFKRFNDNHGHQTGDQVLRFVAAVLSKLAKPGDTPARYGGEEFGIILPNTDFQSAVALAESIRVTVAGKRLRKKQTGKDIGSITLSLGVACFKAGEPLTTFIKRADDSLYHAKHLGRNRVVGESEITADSDWKLHDSGSAIRSA